MQLALRTRKLRVDSHRRCWTAARHGSCGERAGALCDTAEGVGGALSLRSRMPRLKSDGSIWIDRLAWRAGACIEAHGVRLGVRTNAPEMLVRLERCLPPGWRPSASRRVDELFSLWVGG